MADTEGHDRPRGALASLANRGLTDGREQRALLWFLEQKQSGVSVGFMMLEVCVSNQHQDSDEDTTWFDEETKLPGNMTTKMETGTDVKH
ncbi:hypothetical protein PBY51_015565 [Eleginops maclovinus]|uniref:Uncharacterized protein n=1 Tax=Eleginops maclovinus TaxID=56733 RepID=A0AAN8ALF0_ELEMC|nr:hypothetical protein PBY51_015565 [Eleginops maclovinus]